MAQKVEHANPLHVNAYAVSVTTGRTVEVSGKGMALAVAYRVYELNGVFVGIQRTDNPDQDTYLVG